MSKIITLVILLCFLSESIATRQQPDNLEYSNLKLKVIIGWGHPSPLQVYYYQNHLKYPFESIGTGNYRGHIANWIIKDNKLFLKEILTKKNDKYVEDSNGGYYEFCYKSNTPRKFKVKSKTKKNDSKNGIYADWFSGVLECYLDEKDSVENVSRFYFLIRNGNVIEMLRRNDEDKLSPGKLAEMSHNYKAFYYRLKNDDIVLNNVKCRLNTDFVHLSPVFLYFGTDLLKFPYNWENIKLSGAPHCEWLIENSKLYLTNLTLYSGTRFDTIFQKTIDLKTEFHNKVADGKVFADFVSGVYLVKHGIDTNYRDSEIIKYFKITQYTFLRINAGIITESFDVDKDINFDKMPYNIDSRLKRLIKEYFLL